MLNKLTKTATISHSLGKTDLLVMTLQPFDYQRIREALIYVEKSGTFLGENPYFSVRKVGVFEE